MIGKNVCDAILWEAITEVDSTLFLKINNRSQRFHSRFLLTFDHVNHHVCRLGVARRASVIAAMRGFRFVDHQDRSVLGQLDFHA